MTAPRTAPRRVLMTADTVGGVWTYALELAAALAPHAVFFDIATLGAPLSPAQWADARALPNVRIHESVFKLEWMPDPWADVAASGDWLLRLEAETRPDIVHLNGFAHGALPFRAPTLVAAHSCVLSWWRAVKGEAAPADWNRYARAVRRGLGGASTIVAPSQTMLNALCEHYGPFAPAATLAVVPNCRQAARFPFAAPGDKEPLIFAAGRLWDEAKNVAALDMVAPSLPWPVVVAGDSSGDNHGDNGGGARRLGHLAPPALAHWLRRAAVYALPARYEPFGLSILEAALAGCALVLGDIDSLREVWGDEAAWYVPPGDPNALRTALCRLSADADARTRLSSAARERALRRYAPERTAEATLRAYDDAKNGHRLLT